MTEKNSESEDVAETERSRQMSGGVVLPSRPTQVTLLERPPPPPADEVSVGGSSSWARRDSLEDTKSFYGVRSNSIAGAASRLETLRGRGSMSSRITTDSRPTSPQSMSTESHDPTSPQRRAVPLPMPRGFLTPKKPPAAIRQEQRERQRSSVSRRPFSEIEPLSNSDSPAQILPRDPTVDQYRPAEPQPLSLDAILTSGPTEDPPLPASVSRSMQLSVTEASTPPHHHIDLSSDDLVSEDHEKPATKVDTISKSFSRSGSRRRVRKYKTFNNPLTTWFCGGHMMTGGDSPHSMALTLVLLFGISGLWVGTTGWWLWAHGSDYGLVNGGGVGVMVVFIYLFGLTVSSILVSALRDPGIIPRGLDPDPPLEQDGDWEEAKPRQVSVGNANVPIKYCETCKTYRAPRSSHCRLCGNCVDGIDHHCSYIHTCVGRRTYLSFLVLLISATISSIYVVIFSGIHFALLCHHDHISFGRALRESPGAAVSFLLGLLVLPGICFLLWYHLRLLLYNLTTVEQIRANASSSLFFSNRKANNPFAARSKLSNMLLSSLARPQFPSWIDAAGWKEDDSRLVNPALTDPKYSREVV
ncbi:DHHC palmitoyltransferase-domain-containing protein [Naematelia encephala]|uniref:Palmitoyltransferase n=1 Tax=Naematelia encephala TaxID=71784 RepID=A0A1Y2BGP2_9TREE|nr:DHHC palmitoyltransferase-domain-containing protein [Naematelia encephala]